MVLTQSFNGAGDTWTPTSINLLVFWVLELPLAWVLSHAGGLEATGVFVALAVAYSMLAVVSAVLFRQREVENRAGVASSQEIKRPGGLQEIRDQEIKEIRESDG